MLSSVKDLMADWSVILLICSRKGHILHGHSINQSRNEVWSCGHGVIDHWISSNDEMGVMYQNPVSSATTSMTELQ